MGRLLTQEEFIERSILVHKNKFDYSLVKYINSGTPVLIVCKKNHHEFKQTPNHHMRGIGCAKCSGFKKKTNDEFIKDARLIHGNTYDYSLIEYINTRSPVTIICRIHGKFSQIAGNHISKLQRQGCPNCGVIRRANTQRRTDNEFLELAQKVHNNFYDYSPVDYKGANKVITVICPIHGSFKQSPNAHLRGCGCAKCYFNKLSTKNNHIKISKRQRDIMIGHLLGDGTISNGKLAINQSFGILRSKKDSDYLIWSMDQLKTIIKSKPHFGKSKSPSTFSFCENIAFKTISHKDITQFRKEWYVGRKKNYS